MKAAQQKTNVKAKFKSICKLANELKEMIADHTADTTEGSNLYYSKMEILRKLMIEFLRLDFRVLSAKELLTLCSLVSSYRPVEPHSFLTTCSILNNN